MTPLAYRAARQSLGLTQEQLARLTGVTVYTICRRENGRQRITERAALELERLGVPAGGP